MSKLPVEKVEEEDEEEEEEEEISPNRQQPLKFNRRFPFCKDIYTCKRFTTKKVIWPNYDVKNGNRTQNQHCLKVFVNRPILLRGFGIYGPIIVKNLNVIFGVYTRDFCIKDTLVEAQRFIKFDGHRNIYPLLFKTPLYLNCFIKYIFYLNVGSHITYSGVMGKDRVLCDEVTFMFLNVEDCNKLSNIKSGNFPEIYFSIPKLDKETCKLHRNIPIEYIEEENRNKKYSKSCTIVKKPEKKESKPRKVEKIENQENLNEAENADGTVMEVDPDYS